jgi:hypothetical protein
MGQGCKQAKEGGPGLCCEGVMAGKTLYNDHNLELLSTGKDWSTAGCLPQEEFQMSHVTQRGRGNNQIPYIAFSFPF